MKIKHMIAVGLVGVCTTLPGLVNAKVSEQERERLKKELSPMGAEIAGNADGSIPAWTGSMRGLPAGLQWAGSGDVLPNPYGDDKVLFTITAKNMEKYADKLSVGQKAMLTKYPDSFNIPVYPTHRDGRYNQLHEDRTWFNATHSELVEGPDNIRNFTGGAPFPIPASAPEVIMNGRVIMPAWREDSLRDDVAVYPNGNVLTRQQRIFADYPWANPKNKVGLMDEEISINAAGVLAEITAPARSKGQLTIINEPLDAISHKRKAWIYMPGSRRVRRAPTVGYDTPDGPGGLLTIDDTLGFNGALDRYEWTLVGKKEMYVPFHAYKFDDPNVKYKELLPPGHANPDWMRYELRRCWVVEANLKEGARHVYAKRRMYIDEDSWQFVMTENYDGRGELWRTSIMNTVYDFYVKGYLARGQMFHDLQSGAYVSIRTVNETRPDKWDREPLGMKYYTPQNLRKLGRR